jgi:uncharacterized membrane protein
MHHRKHKYDIIVILSLLGFADSVYLTVTKALGVAVPCDLTHGCGTVLSSQYSMFLGVPLAVWGIVFFSGTIIAALLANHYAVWRRLLTVGLGVGSLASLVFLALQFFVIKEVCQYCLVTDVLAIALLVLDLNIEHQKMPDLG